MKPIVFQILELIGTKMKQKDINVFFCVINKKYLFMLPVVKLSFLRFVICADCILMRILSTSKRKKTLGASFVRKKTFPAIVFVLRH